jgi:hypothetical protein
MSMRVYREGASSKKGKRFHSPASSFTIANTRASADHYRPSRSTPNTIHTHAPKERHESVRITESPFPTSATAANKRYPPSSSLFFFVRR